MNKVTIRCLLTALWTVVFGLPTMVHSQEQMVLMVDASKSVDQYIDECVKNLIRSQLSKADGEKLPYLTQYAWKSDGDGLGRMKLVFFKHEIHEEDSYVFSPDGISVTDKYSRSGYTILEMSPAEFELLTQNALPVPSVLKTRRQVDTKYTLLNGADSTGDVVSWSIQDGRYVQSVTDKRNLLVVRDRFTYKVSMKDEASNAWTVFHLIAMINLYGVEIENSKVTGIYCEFDTRDRESDFHAQIKEIIGGNSSVWDEYSNHKWMRPFIVSGIKYIDMNNQKVPRHSDYVMDKFYDAIHASSGVGLSTNFAIFNYSIGEFAATITYYPGNDYQTYNHPNGYKVNNLETRIRYQVLDVHRLDAGSLWVHDLSRKNGKNLRRVYGGRD